MGYNWIYTKGLEELKEAKIILFGAGKGAEEALEFITAKKLNLQITCLLDNDKTLHGKQLSGIPIFDPADIKSLNRDLIVVTSISGRESISEQLKMFGLEKGQDFVCIGKYPSGYLKNIQEILLFQDENSLIGKRCLHVGPGGFLGLELCLHAYGAEKIYSVDKFGFGLQGNDIRAREKEYLEVRKFLEKSSSVAHHVRRRLERFDSAIVKNNSTTLIDEKIITYCNPVDVQAMPFEDNFFDCVYSFALLEHVEDQAKAIEELSRVTKNGGINLHTIVTEDHRSFSAFEEYHPFSFRVYSDGEWQEMKKNTFYQNRVIPAQWKKLCVGAGFRIRDYCVRETVDVDSFGYDQFHQSFKAYSKQELGEIGCRLLLQKC